jgi:hypothetical protein
MLLSLLVFLLRHLGRLRSLGNMYSSIRQHGWSSVPVFVFASVVVLGVLWSFLMAVVVVPDDWDAWAQWAAKSKVLALFPQGIQPVEYFVPGSADYPLLWPSVWAFAGWCAGGWEEIWSRGWGAVFLLLTALQLRTCTRRLGGGAVWGWLVAALFVSMPSIPLIASMSYAEAPLWLMQVCFMTEILCWCHSRDRSALWRASIFLTGAAMTKNEGILLACVVFVWIVIMTRNLKDWVAIALLPILFVGCWRGYVALHVEASNHAMQSISMVSMFAKPWLRMLSTIGAFIIREWFSVRQWLLVLPATLWIGVWYTIRKRGATRLAVLLPLGMLSGYIMVIMMYGEKWEWQLHVAWNRLTVQFIALWLPVLAARMAEDPT